MDSEPIWDVQYQRYLKRQFDSGHQRWYRTHYVEGKWVFFDWLPATHMRVDSASSATAQPVRQGVPVRGWYNPKKPQKNSYCEPLDPSYYVRDGKFFKVGKVFSVLFTEAAGTNVTSYNKAFSAVIYGELAHTQIRRFIVVKQKREYCFAVPIFTYGNQGTKKHGVVAKEHSIVYTIGYRPTLLENEIGIIKEPIAVVNAAGLPALSIASRIYFGIHHPIQFNVKVKDLGDVYPPHLVNLKGYWNMENLNDTDQDIEVTAQAWDIPPTQFAGAPEQPSTLDAVTSTQAGAAEQRGAYHVASTQASIPTYPGTYNISSPQTGAPGQSGAYNVVASTPNDDEEEEEEEDEEEDSDDEDSDDDEDDDNNPERWQTYAVS
ncbi:hypothetical protein ACN47E_008672 [Coniothyrium glycines]